MRLKVNDIVWVLGITTKRMGTQHPYSYYLPIKARIGWIEEYSYGRVFHVCKLHKPKKYFRNIENTRIVNECVGYSKKEISTSLIKIQRLCRNWNKS